MREEKNYELFNFFAKSIDKIIIAPLVILMMFLKTISGFKFQLQLRTDLFIIITTGGSASYMNIYMYM